MSESVSPQQEAILRRIKQKQSLVNEIFKELEIKKQDIIDKVEDGAAETQSHSQTIHSDSYLEKYKDYSIDKIRKNYEEAFLPFKWYQLPFCRKVVYEKMQFCVPANLLMLTAYMLWKKMGDNPIKFSLKGSLKMYLGLTAITWTAVFAQSILFEPYCDINSQHYNNKISNFQLAKQLKKQYKELYPK